MGAFHILKGLSFISPLVSYHFHLTSIITFLKIPAFSFLALVSSGFLLRLIEDDGFDYASV